MRIMVRKRNKKRKRKNDSRYLRCVDRLQPSHLTFPTGQTESQDSKDELACKFRQVRLKQPM